MRDNSLKLDTFLLASVVIYVVCSAARDVCIHQILGSNAIPLSEIVFLSLLPVCILGSLIVNSRRRVPCASDSDDFRECRLIRDATIKLNITSAATYSLVFLSLDLLLPITATSVGIGVVPVFIVLSSRDARQNKWLAAVFVVIGLLGLSWQAVRDPFASNYVIALLGLFVALLGGYFASKNIVFSSRLKNLKVSADRIFASRFWLLLVSSFGWSIGRRTISNSWSGISSMSSGSLCEAILIGIFGIFMPLYFYQHVIAKSNPLFAAFSVAMIPPAVFVMQMFRGVGSVSTFQIASVLTVAVGIFLGLRVSSRPSGPKPT